MIPGGIHESPIAAWACPAIRMPAYNRNEARGKPTRLSEQQPLFPRITQVDLKITHDFAPGAEGPFANSRAKEPPCFPRTPSGLPASFWISLTTSQLTQRHSSVTVGHSRGARSYWRSHATQEWCPESRRPVTSLIPSPARHLLLAATRENDLAVERNREHSARQSRGFQHLRKQVPAGGQDQLPAPGHDHSVSRDTRKVRCG